MRSYAPPPGGSSWRILKPIFQTASLPTTKIYGLPKPGLRDGKPAGRTLPPLPRSEIPMGI